MKAFTGCTLPHNSHQSGLPNREPRGRAPGVAARRFDQWNLLIGLEVEVRLEPGRVISGRIDDAMSDASVAWLVVEGCGRRIIEKSQGHEIWLQSPMPARQDAGTSASL
ncbi:hypothetical protein ABIE00_004708 [Arthrobacter sp. OAP107]